MLSHHFKLSGIGLVLALGCVSNAAIAGVTVPAEAPAKPAAERDAASVMTSDDHPLDGRVLGELNRRKSELDRRERELALRESRAEAAELLARKEVSQLTALRSEVEKMVKQQTSGAESDLAMLASLYSNMKPVQAAAILGKLDSARAAAILKRLETRMAGPVLAAMEPSVAAAITEEMDKAHAAFRN